MVVVVVVYDYGFELKFKMITNYDDYDFDYLKKLIKQ